MIKLLSLLIAAGKLGPAVKTGGTMILSIGVYALIFGWWYAVGFVLLLLVHEMGHYLAARRLGMNVGLPTFIPFVGAWIELKDQPLSVEHEAKVAFAGPFLGTAAATVVLLMAGQLQSPLLMALANAGFFLNLFNLVPISPFDGGRIVAILSPRIWLLGAPILAGIFLLIPSPMFLIILVLLAPTIWQALKSAWRRETPTGNERYYEVPLQSRVRYGSYYLLLLAYLCVMTYQTHEQLSQVTR